MRALLCCSFFGTRSLTAGRSLPRLFNEALPGPVNVSEGGTKCIA